MLFLHDIFHFFYLIIEKVLMHISKKC